MNLEFADDDYRRIDENPSYSGKWSQAIVSKFRNRMQLIRAAADEREFYAMRSLHFAQMKGDRSHQHSIRLNVQWRLIVELKGKGVEKIVLVVGIEDYH